MLLKKVITSIFKREKAHNRRELERQVLFLEEELQRQVGKNMVLKARIDRLKNSLEAQERNLGALSDGNPDRDSNFIEQVGELVRPFIHEIRPQFPIIERHIGEAIDYLEKNDCGTESVKLIKKLSAASTIMEYLNMRMVGLSYLAGKTQDIFKLTDVNQIIRENIRFFRNRYENAIIESSLTNDSTEIWGDKESLNQIVGNLVKNAIEACKERNAHVYLETRRIVEESQWVQIVVKDDGVGIDPDVASMIYDLHYTTNKTGFGIGLYLVKKAVGLHDGQIKCESVPGDHTTFTVSLPVRTAEAQ
jgi:signal transduction histidine kinase